MNTKEYLLSAWSWNPVVIGTCIVAVATYAIVSRFHLSGRAWYFFGAVLVLFMSLASPLNALAAGYLFSAHMLQHMLLLLIVPLLLVLGLPIVNTNTSHHWQRIRVPPLFGWVGGVSAMWVWHERTLCDLAAHTGIFRIIQIGTLLTLGVLFWWPLFGPQTQRRIPPLAGVVYLFSACVACSVLGILIAFAPTGTVCPVFLHPPNRPAVLQLIRQEWGMTAAKDQQIGGLLMWVPGCGIYLAGVMAMLARWYGSAEPEAIAEVQPASKDSPQFLPVHSKAKEF